MVGYVQAIELCLFLLSGFFLGCNYGFQDNNFMFGAIIFFIVGIFFALIASEASIEQYKNYGRRK